MNNDANTREGSKQNFLIRILIMSAFLALTVGVMGMTMLDWSTHFAQFVRRIDDSGKLHVEVMIECV